MRRGGNETSGDGNCHRHYSRDERLALSPRLRDACEEEGSGKRSFFAAIFRNNRGMVILLVDVGLLMILFVVYSVLTAGGDALWSRDGFSFQLSAFAYEDKVLASLRVTRRDSAPYAGAAPIVRLWAGEGGGEGVVTAPPSGREESVFVRSVLHRPESGKVFAEVEFGGRKKVLSVPIREE